MYEYLNPFWHKINIVVHIFAFNFDRALLDFQVQHMWIHVSTFYEFVLSLIQSYFNSVLLMICVLASLKIVHFLSFSKNCKIHTSLQLLYSQGNMSGNLHYIVMSSSSCCVQEIWRINLPSCKFWKKKYVINNSFIINIMKLQ